MPYVDLNTIHDPATNTAPPASWGDQVRENLQFLANPPMAKVRSTGTVSLTSATWTIITFNTEDWDTDTLHSTSTNTGRMTATTAGVYHFQGAIRFGANATGSRGAALRKNGTGSGLPTDSNPLIQAAATGPTIVPVTNDIRLSVGDWVELIGYQSSGGALSTENSEGASFLACRWVSL